ncbi:hypothetical protein QBZ16_004805 [Prototheca wickerhamii]|uniref:Uncharacterized protein n=1 Tax=Prototheca wickerhamii TaxID=3111 RepID=A0AAD9IGG5_PROWI|nr:hypothetical protein QBZ16_004805 [Prototheca wickerhamii]
MGADGIIVGRSLPPALITQRAVPAAAASEAEDAREEKGEKVVSLDVEFDRDDPEDIGDVFEPLPPLENVDLDSELDMCAGRSESSITPEDFEPLKSEPLDRPVELDMEMDMRPEDISAEDFEPRVQADPLGRPVNLESEFDRHEEMAEEVK